MRMLPIITFRSGVQTGKAQSKLALGCVGTQMDTDVLLQEGLKGTEEEKE